MRARIGSLLLVAAVDLLAQSPALEVASIRLNEEDIAPSIAAGLRNGRLTAHHVTLKQLLAVAYGITEPQVTGPDTLQKNRFDIVAKAPAGVPDTQLGPLLQSLLRDRFQLAAHFEPRPSSVYHLVVGPGGVKMPVYPAPNSFEPTRGFPMARGATDMANLAKVLSASLGKPVIDQTGLTERYNYVLSFRPVSPQPGEEVAEFGPPDIFTAVQQQLGLKLEPARDEVRILVVDKIASLPSEN